MDDRIRVRITLRKSSAAPRVSCDSMDFVFQPGFLEGLEAIDNENQGIQATKLRWMVPSLTINAYCVKYDEVHGRASHCGTECLSRGSLCPCTIELPYTLKMPCGSLIAT